MPDIHSYEPVWPNWVIDEEIGRGSFGTVWKAHREDSLARFTQSAAVKHISIPSDSVKAEMDELSGLSRDTVRKLYRHELDQLVKEITAMLEIRGRSHIVAYEEHKIVEKPEGMGYDLFLRMELLTSLPNHVKKAGVPGRDEVIRLGIHILRALETLQSRKLIHRDIKPANIFIDAYDDYKLGDFGTARALQATGYASTRAGTPNYMAPEVYNGNANYDQTVDIYSLGIVLYRYMNRGFLPFIDEGAMNPETAIMKRVQGQALPPPGQADEGLSRVILKACAFAPGDRYQSALEMRKDLEALQGARGETLAANCEIRVTCVLEGSRNEIQSKVERCAAGAETVLRAPQLPGYELVGEGSVRVGVDGSGKCPREQVTFTYRIERTVPSGDSVPVICRTEAGEQVYMARVKVKPGKEEWIDAPRVPGYEAVGEKRIRVTHGADGRIRPEAAIFTMRGRPEAVDVPVVDMTTDSLELSQTAQKCFPGQENLVHAVPRKGYRLKSKSPVSVHVGSEGLASPPRVLFVWQKAGTKKKKALAAAVTLLLAAAAVILLVVKPWSTVKDPGLHQETAAPTHAAASPAQAPRAISAGTEAPADTLPETPAPAMETERAPAAALPEAPAPAMETEIAPAAALPETPAPAMETEIAPAAALPEAPAPAMETERAPAVPSAGEGAVIASADGFVGPVRVALSFEEDGATIKAISIGDESFAETEGYGKAALEPGFAAQFIGRKAPLEMGDIEALSGATVTTKAVLEAINAAYGIQNPAAAAAPDAETTSSAMPQAASAPVPTAGELVEAAIREALNSPEGPLTDEMLSRLGSLRVNGQGRQTAGSLGLLSRCTNLTELEMTNLGLYDLSFVSALENLRSLNAGNNRIGSLEDVAALSRLESLDVSGNQIKGIEGVSNLVSLKTLNLDDNRVYHLHPLSSLGGLTELSVRNNFVSDVSPLFGLAGLKELNVQGNPFSVTDFDALRAALPLCAINGVKPNRQAAAEAALLQSMQSVLGAMPDGPDEESFKRLTFFDLKDAGTPEANNIAFLMLREAVNIDVLQIMRLGINDLAPVANMPNLREIYAYENNISDLGPMAGLVNLQFANLYGNQISDLTPLAGLKRLQKLYLHNNLISDITPLLGLTNLRDLDLIGNPVSEADLERLREALPQCAINGQLPPIP